jgi:hypothetical protein
MDMTIWAYALELANVSIPRAVQDLHERRASEQDLQELVRILRRDGWEFVDQLADALGLPVLPELQMPGFGAPGGYPPAAYQPGFAPAQPPAPYAAAYAPVIPPQPAAGGWSHAQPAPYGQAYYAPPQHPMPLMQAIQPGWQQQAFVNPAPVQPPPPALSQADRVRYDQLAAGSGLFGTGRMTRVRRSDVPASLAISDVAMDRVKAIVCTGPETALGTVGLGPCIAVCARGLNFQNQVVIGLWHASYDEDQNRLLNNLRAGFNRLIDKMRRQGAGSVEFSLAGGMKQPNARCIEFGQAFLSLRNEYSIVAAEIHHCEREDQATDVIMAAGGTFHGVNLYDPPPF